MEEEMKVLKIRVPLAMYEKIAALVESENQLKGSGPVSVADWIAWSASYCMEKQSRSIAAFHRSTFTCDGCNAILRYTAMCCVIRVGNQHAAYCRDCWPIRAKHDVIAHGTPASGLCDK